MPIEFVVHGDLLTEEADALVNTVNCDGFMGKGVALQFARDKRFKSPPRARLRWSLEADYVKRCERKEVRPGRPYVWAVPQIDPPPLSLPWGDSPNRRHPTTGNQTSQPTRFVINFPTKDRWRGRSRLVWISEGLKRLPYLISEYEITSLAMPAIGCGLGGLDWATVRPLIEQALGGEAITVRVHEPPRTRGIES